MSLSERLRLFIKTVYDNKVSVFAQVAEIKENSVYRYLAAKQSPDADALVKMEQNAGVNISWLLTGNGAMYANNEAGRAIYKKVTGKDSPEMVVKPLDGDKAEAVRQSALEILKLLDK
jgi:phage repressor protein C with HTH and peptisase S24 domain